MPRMNKRTRMALTAKQSEVLSFIKSFTSDYGYPPSVRDMQDAFEFQSPNSVIQHLRALERKGWIQREPMLSRAIRVIP